MDFFFRFSNDYYREKRALEIVSNFTYDVIIKRRKIMQTSDINSKSIIESDESPKQKLAFLDTLLKTQINGKSLTNKEIADEVSTFIFEGHDTTAVALSFAMYALSIYPDVQEKVYEEQKLVYGNDQNCSPTYQEIQNMKYMDLFLKEVFRLYPSVPYIGRKIKKAFDLSKHIYVNYCYWLEM